MRQKYSARWRTRRKSRWCRWRRLSGPRADTLFQLDRENDLRVSHKNPSVVACYDEFFEKLLSKKSHRLLHTDHDGCSL
ncbi:MAG: hypothetical protein HFH60_03230 [Lachnospiraceae bacterium]|nr:hypothetical protein [Lachnospiraceae bacterium]